MHERYNNNIDSCTYCGRVGGSPGPRVHGSSGPLGVAQWGTISWKQAQLRVSEVLYVKLVKYCFKENLITIEWPSQHPLHIVVLKALISIFLDFIEL